MRLNGPVDTAHETADRPHQGSLPLSVLGTTVHTDLAGPLRQHPELVREAWSRCLRPAASSAHPGPSPVAGQEDSTPAPGGPSQELAAAMESLTTSTTLAGIERHRGRSLMFHAAGLADPATGATVALVAASGTGKTTAARALGNRLAYVSDETVCVDPGDLAVIPYPKPLSLVQGPHEPKRQVSPDELGLRHLDGPAHLHALVLLERSGDQDAAQLTDPLPLVTALSALVPNTSALPSLPNPLSTLVRVVGACGGVRAVRYREIEDARELLLRLAESPPAPESRPTPPRSWTPSSPAAGGPAPAPDAPGAGGDPAAVGLAQWVEALENPEDPSQLLVLLPERLVVLAGIGPHLWHACRRAGSLPLPELAAAVERECGANPQAQVLTRRCAARLESLGVLRRGPAPAGGAVE